MGETLPLFKAGFLSTLTISAAAFVGALVIGVLACAMSLQTNRLIRGSAVAYIDAIRATPLLAQLYFLYFGLPILGVVMPEIVVGILALSLNSGAYTSEIIRSGIIGIPAGQMEASASSGMTYSQQMRLVVMPQAIKVILPALGNQFVYVMKMSSLVSVIGLEELTRRSNELNVSEYRPLEIYTFLVLEYLVLIVFVSWLVRRLERRMATAH